MIQTLRIMTGKDRVDASTWFDLEADRPRAGATTTRNAAGHHAIRPRDFKYEERGEFFTNRVVKHYNELPDAVKQAKNINIFTNSHQNRSYAGVSQDTVVSYIQHKYDLLENFNDFE